MDIRGHKEATFPIFEICKTGLAHVAEAIHDRWLDAVFDYLVDGEGRQPTFFLAPLHTIILHLDKQNI